MLCITRGDEAGVRVQDEAIALARDRGEALVFLYVADCSFLDKIAVCVIWRLAKKELAKMGRFILAIAVESALAEGGKSRGSHPERRAARCSTTGGSRNGINDIFSRAPGRGNLQIQ